MEGGLKPNNLGPDAWTSKKETIFNALRKKKGLIKHALLNQSVVAGLGNIYVDESLFRTKIHPLKKMEKLSNQKIQDLCVSIHSVLKESIDLGGTSFRNYVDTSGGRGGFKGRLNVYGKENTPCIVCSTLIKKIVAAGRGTHFCPNCQGR
jgi:formamidopyrimidine-DNA glycosylase